MKIVEANIADKTAIDTFYVEQGYHSNWSETERAFICRHEDKVIGAVKVERIEGVSILRGMYIDEAFQKMGLGSQFLQHIEPILNETLSYCMPLAHVASFYTQIHFNEVFEQEYPAFLAERCKAYRAAGYEIKTMRRAKKL